MPLEGLNTKRWPKTFQGCLEGWTREPWYDSCGPHDRYSDTGVPRLLLTLSTTLCRGCGIAEMELQNQLQIMGYSEEEGELLKKTPESMNALRTTTEAWGSKGGSLKDCGFYQSSTQVRHKCPDCLQTLGQVALLRNHQRGGGGLAVSGRACSLQSCINSLQLKRYLLWGLLVLSIGSTLASQSMFYLL